MTPTRTTPTPTTALPPALLQARIDIVHSNTFLLFLRTQTHQLAH